MNESEIKSKLDQLSDFQAHRDLLESDKRALLEDVKVPAEVEEIVSAGMKQMGKVEASFDGLLDALRISADKELEAIVIPVEIKAALDEIDRQRKQVRDTQFRAECVIREKIRSAKEILSDQAIAQTVDVYKAIAQRKAEIEAEFSGKSEAVDDNIRKLTEEIKAEVKALGATVKADHFQAVYVKGRVIWDASKMDGYAVGHPEVLFMRKEGEPSVTLRRI